MAAIYQHEDSPRAKNIAHADSQPIARFVPQLPEHRMSQRGAAQPGYVCPGHGPSSGLIHRYVPVHAESQNADIDGTMLRQPLGNSRAFRLRVRGIAAKANRTFRADT